MNLLSRVLKLESRLIKPVQPVKVAFQKMEEADDEFEKKIKTENSATEALLILVKFVQSNR